MELLSRIGKLTLRQRLIAIIFLVSAIASTLGFVTTAVRDLRYTRHALSDNAKVIARTAATYSSGSVYSCALDVDGFMGCTSYISTATPMYMAGLAGDYDTMCGVSMGGQAHCAGKSNYSGTLCVGMTPAASSVFLPLPNIPTTVVKVLHNAKRGVALTATGDIWRWGDGWQTNTGPNPWAVTPAWTPVAAGSGAKDVALGEKHICTIGTADPGQINCRGGYSGSNGSYTTTSWPAPSGVILEKLAMASEHGCAIDSLGRVLCWGQAGWGKLGYTTTSVGA